MSRKTPRKKLSLTQTNPELTETKITKRPSKEHFTLRMYQEEINYMENKRHELEGLRGKPISRGLFLRALLNISKRFKDDKLLKEIKEVL